MKWGAGLRASQALILAGKARALLAGRFHVSIADVRALAPSVLRHRITTSFYADAEQVTVDGVIARLIETVPAPKSGLVDDGGHARWPIRRTCSTRRSWPGSARWS